MCVCVRGWGGWGGWVGTWSTSMSRSTRTYCPRFNRREARIVTILVILREHHNKGHSHTICNTQHCKKSEDMQSCKNPNPIPADATASATEAQGAAAGTCSTEYHTGYSEYSRWGVLSTPKQRHLPYSFMPFSTASVGRSPSHSWSPATSSGPYTSTRPSVPSRASLSSRLARTVARRSVWFCSEAQRLAMHAMQRPVL